MADDNAFNSIVAETCLAWPEHKRFLDRAWATASCQATANRLALDVLRIAQGRLESLIKGYRWMCGMMLEEELHFRRHGAYRMSSFAEVDALVYQSPETMRRYMDGLLLSQVLWPNHVRAMEFYLSRFLAAASPAARHLEIGPGHGLLLHYAAEALATRPEAWDISPACIEMTRQCLRALGSAGRGDLLCRDVMAIDVAQCGRYDSIVLSEVLEHSEVPGRMLCKVAALLAPGGRLYVNVPVNSPSIDHIALFASPEEVLAMIERAGLEIESYVFAPAAGHDEAAARKKAISISCAIIARPNNGGSQNPAIDAPSLA